MERYPVYWKSDALQSENEEMDISNFSSVSSIVQLVEKKIRLLPVYAK